MLRKRKLAERLRAELKLLMARVCAHLMSGARGDGGSGCAGGGSSDGGESGGARSDCPAHDRMYACVLQARSALEATNSNSGASAAASSSTSALKKTSVCGSVSGSASRSEPTRDQSRAAQHN